MFTSDEPPPSKAKRLGELFDAEGCTAHVTEPCHAVVVERRSWGQGVDTFEVCTDPRRHTPSRVGTAKGSDLASDASRPRSGGDDSHAKRQGRVSRLAHLAETFSRSRGGISQADLTRAALRGLVFEAGREALAHAATILGHDQPRDVTVDELLDGVDTPGALARIAGAVALGLAETHMYWATTSPPCRDYLDLLVGSGWTPDDWTAAALANHTSHHGDPDTDDATADVGDRDDERDDSGDGSQTHDAARHRGDDRDEATETYDESDVEVTDACDDIDQVDGTGDGNDVSGPDPNGDGDAPAA